MSGFVNYCKVINILQVIAQASSSFMCNIWIVFHCWVNLYFVYPFLNWYAFLGVSTSWILLIMLLPTFMYKKRSLQRKLVPTVISALEKL